MNEAFINSLKIFFYIQKYFQLSTFLAISNLYNLALCVYSLRIFLPPPPCTTKWEVRVYLRKKSYLRSMIRSNTC